MFTQNEFSKVCLMVLIYGVSSMGLSYAQSISTPNQLPGAADPSRVDGFGNVPIPNQMPKDNFRPNFKIDEDVPENFKDIEFIVKQVNFAGITVFTDKELGDILINYINKPITLDQLWQLSADITALYQNKGYFLSRAYVPQQEIDSGIIQINVIEGYIADVQVNHSDYNGYRIIRKLIEQLKYQAPISAYDIESFMLQMNALAGETYTSVLETIENGPDGATRLILNAKGKAPNRSISFDNFGSRFLGPYQAMASYQAMVLPLQTTNVTLLGSLPADELKYIALNHRLPIAPDWTATLAGNYIVSSPGASLAVNDLNNRSYGLTFGIEWHPIRLRQENLIMSLDFNGKNTNGNIFEFQPFVRDRIRALRWNLSYDTADHFNGYNYLNFGIDQGIGILGSSQAGDLNLSRAEARPDFTVAKFSYNRQQALPWNFLGVLQTSGQFASAALFSAEEFGYGGMSFGRAYDPSELIGDHGLATSVELRYLGVDIGYGFGTTPYVFYDIGRVWNEDQNSVTTESATSAGFGLRMSHQVGITSNFGLAWPLTRQIDTPIYGDHNNPRIIMQIGLNF